jgi:hypothetical protein
MTVGFDDLSSDVQDMITKLEVEVDELRFEANFNRATTLVVFLFLAERIWHFFF